MLRDVIQLCEDDDPATALVGLRELRTYARQREREVVVASREAGWSWRQIALVLDVPAQTLHRRYANDA